MLRKVIRELANISIVLTMFALWAAFILQSLDLIHMEVEEVLISILAVLLCIGTTGMLGKEKK